LKVRLDIYGEAPTPAAYAEASASRSKQGPSDGAGRRQLLYQLTKQLMDDINVEFEFQVRHSLRNWLPAPTSPGAVPATIEEQGLAPPR
jgi:hypothetical protein